MSGYTVDELGGACPTQATGHLADGRPFYFRARHGEWTLHVGPVGASDADDFRGNWIIEDACEVASGDDDTNGYMNDAEVRAILDANFGAVT